MTTQVGRTVRRLLLSVFAPGAVVFGSVLTSCEGLLTTFNTCGTIFGFCQEEDLDLLLCDRLPCFDVDPTCTIPFATGQGCAGQAIWPNPGPRP